MKFTFILKYPCPIPLEVKLNKVNLSTKPPALFYSLDIKNNN